MNDTLIMRGLLAFALAVAVLPAMLGVALFSGFESEHNSTIERLLSGSFLITATLAIIGGLMMSTTRPVLGIGLVALPAISISVMLWWMAVIVAPIGVALVFLAYWRARGTGWPSGAGTA